MIFDVFFVEGKNFEIFYKFYIFLLAFFSLICQGHGVVHLIVYCGLNNCCVSVQWCFSFWTETKGLFFGKCSLLIYCNDLFFCLRIFPKICCIILCFTVSYGIRLWRFMFFWYLIILSVSRVRSRLGTSWPLKSTGSLRHPISIPTCISELIIFSGKGKLSKAHIRHLCDCYWNKKKRNTTQ